MRNLHAKLISTATKLQRRRTCAKTMELNFCYLNNITFFRAKEKVFTSLFLFTSCNSVHSNDSFSLKGIHISLHLSYFHLPTGWLISKAPLLVSNSFLMVNLTRRSVYFVFFAHIQTTALTHRILPVFCSRKHLLTNTHL